MGAGAGGLEAAITAAICGHQVEIYEKDSDIGGQLWIAGAPPHKQEILEFIRYYRAQIHKHQIPLHLNTSVDSNVVKQQSPDYVILAEGAEPLLPQIDGYDDPRVYSAWQVLKGNPVLGKSVAVIGGGSVGLETAVFIAAKGTITPEILHFLFSYEAVSPERLREYVAYFDPAFRGLTGDKAALDAFTRAAGVVYQVPDLPALQQSLTIPANTCAEQAFAATGQMETQ